MKNSFHNFSEVQKYFAPGKAPNTPETGPETSDEGVNTQAAIEAAQNTALSHSERTEAANRTADALEEWARKLEAQVQVTRDTLSPEQGEQLDADMNKLRQERDNKVTDIQEKTREGLQAQQVEAERKYSDHAVKLEWDEKGNITRESLINLISDLDHDKEVEVQNNSWWNRVVRGQGRQRFAFGESQLKHALRNVSMDQLNALYTRLTGDTNTLNFTQADTERVDRATGKDSNAELVTVLNRDKIAQIHRLQNALRHQTDALADIMAVIMGPDNKSKIEGVNGDVRAGLISVINGNEGALLSALNDPQKQQEFAEIVKNSPAIKNDRNLLGRIVSALLHFGFSVAANVLSGGTLSLGYQSEDLDSNKLGAQERENGKMWERHVDLASGEISKIVGDRGRVGVDLNLLGARIFANWNDPKAVIGNALTAYRSAENPRLGVEYVVQATEKEIERVNPKKRHVVQNISREFSAAQSLLIDQRDRFANQNPEDPRIKKIDQQLENNMTVYIGKVMEAQGMKLQGVGLDLSYNSLAFVVSAAGVNIHTPDASLNKGAAQIEATANQKEASQEQVDTLLGEYKISKHEDGSYYQDGKQVVRAPKENERIVWNVKEYVYPTSSELQATATIVDKNTNRPLETIQLQNQNTEVKNEVIDANSSQVAQELRKIRSGRNKNHLVAFQNAVRDRDTSKAEQELLLATKWSPIEQVVKKSLAAATTPEEKNQTLDIFLARTSGGSESVRLAKNFENGQDFAKNRAELLKYYHSKIGPTFARMYNIPVADVNKMVESMVASAEVAKSSTLGDHMKQPGGFRAVVAYSQIAGFKGLNNVYASNTRIFGAPQEVTGANADKVRQAIARTISEVDINAQLQHLKEQGVTNVSEEEVRRLMVSGKVHSYLSYEPDAECFNLGFFVEPGFVEIPSRPNETPHQIATGSVVSNEVVAKSQFSVGAGVDLRKLKKNPPKNNPPNNTTPGEARSSLNTTPGSGGIADNLKSPSTSGIDIKSSIPTDGIKNVPKGNVPGLENFF